MDSISNPGTCSAPPLSITMAPFDRSVMITRLRPRSSNILPANSAERSSVMVMPVRISACEALGVSMDIDLRSSSLTGKAGVGFSIILAPDDPARSAANLTVSMGISS
jgi:hypothetical protein